MLLRPAAAVAFGLLVASPAHSQTNRPTPSDPEIRALIRSPRAIDVAWGAYWAGELGWTEMIPDLLQALGQTRSDRDVDRELLAAEALDALVRLRAVAPVALVRQYYDRWPVQALALWNKPSAGRDEILLALIRPARGPRWFGLANLLLQGSPKGLAPALLETPLTLHVSVSESGGAGMGAGILAGASGDNPQPTTPYPPVPIYRFSEAQPWTPVLSTGPMTLYYEREVTTRWNDQFAGASRGGPSPADRVTYLGALARTTFSPSAVVSLKWVDAIDLERRVRSAQLALRTEYERVFALLIRRGLLDVSEARDLTAVIDARVTDLRRSRSSPLPDLPPLRR